MIAKAIKYILEPADYAGIASSESLAKNAVFRLSWTVDSLRGVRVGQRIFKGIY